jgi:hypothetical protein
MNAGPLSPSQLVKGVVYRCYAQSVAGTNNEMNLFVGYNGNQPVFTSERFAGGQFILDPLYWSFYAV